MVRVRERRPETALMSERSQGVHVYIAGGGLGKRVSYLEHISYTS